jgi:hypothetical protein
MEVVIIVAAAFVVVRGMHYCYPLAKRLVEATARRIEDGGTRSTANADAETRKAHARLEENVQSLTIEVDRLREQQQFLEHLLKARPAGAEPHALPPAEPPTASARSPR